MKNLWRFPQTAAENHPSEDWKHPLGLSVQDTQCKKSAQDLHRRLLTTFLPHSFSGVDTRVHNTVLTTACGTKSKFNSMFLVSWPSESHVSAAPAQIFKVVLISDPIKETRRETGAC